MTNESLDNDALIQSDLAHNESTKPKLSLSEFLAREDLCKNSNGKYVPNNQQLKILVRYDEINLGDIDTSKITNMKDLFKNSTRQDFSGIEKWNVESVTTFMSAFDGAKHFNADISGGMSAMPQTLYKCFGMLRRLISLSASGKLPKQQILLECFVTPKISINHCKIGICLA